MANKMRENRLRSFLRMDLRSVTVSLSGKYL